MSDIIFEDSEEITVACSNLKVQGHDLLLDSPERRRRGGSNFRRALVHDQNDGLTLNFNNDYPGGVSINGVRSLEVIISHHDELLLKGGSPPDEKVNLGDVIKTLRQEIANLQAQISKLGPRP